MWIKEIEKIVKDFYGDVGLIIRNLNTNEEFTYNSDMIFPSASIIKVPILVSLFEEYRKGKLDINEYVNLEDTDRVKGYGIVKSLSSDLKLTLRDYAVLMITLSDNIATNKIISILTMDLINVKLKELGMHQTVLGRKMMDFAAKEKGLDNYTSPKDIATIFSILHNKEEYREELGILSEQLCNDLLPVWTNHDFVFPHKTGELTGVKHDTGIMYLKDPIMVIMLIKGLVDNNEGVKIHNEVGRIIYNTFKNDEGLKSEF